MRPAFLFAMLFLGIAQISLAVSVNIDYDKNADFSGIKTYSWEPGTPAPNPLSDQRIINAVDYHLSMKGYELVEADPDVYVSYHAAAEKDIRVYEWGHRGPRWGYASRDIDVETVLIGTLIVDISSKDDKLLWRGIGRDTVSESPQRNEKKINKAVEKMFKKFPPEKK